MHRKSRWPLIPFDPEIERTFRRLRGRRQARLDTNSEQELNINMDGANANVDINPNLNIAPEIIEENNGVHQLLHRRTIRDINQEESDATMERIRNSFPDYNFEFEVKGPLFNNLPKFYGLSGENPYMHLNTLQMHCRIMKARAVSVEDVMWKVFHLTLEGKAREWYMNFLRYMDNPYASWKNLRRAFLEQYFPATKSSAAKKEIAAARQDITESFFDFWSRFQDMIEKCPNHQFSKKSLVECFVDGLLPQDSAMLQSMVAYTIKQMKKLGN